MRLGDHYAPRVLQGPGLPGLRGTSLAGAIWLGPPPALMVGGFDLDSLLEQDVWRRLLEGVVPDGATAHFGVLRTAWPPAIRDDLADATPLSRHGVQWAWEDDGTWRSLIAPDRVGRSFALCRDQDEVFLVVGKPNESVWATFLQRVQALRPDA